MSLDLYIKFIHQINTPKRFQHSQAVMQLMGELSEVYDLEKELAQTVGILHDAAKDLPSELIDQFMQEGRIEIRFECENDYVYYLHGPVGSYYVHRELGITDTLILDAITSHTYCGDGVNFNHRLTWCLRFADLLEPNRNWSRWPWLHIGVQNLKSLVFNGQLPESAYLQTSMLLKFFTDLHIPIHPNIRRVNQELASQLNLEPGFFERHISA